MTLPHTEQPETRPPWRPFRELEILRDSDARVIAATASALTGLAVQVDALGPGVAGWLLMDDEVQTVRALRGAA